jgi:phosphohistidine phosphatase
MRRILLLRHAKSDWSDAGTADHERPLNRRGEEAAPKIGAYLARHRLIPERVLCSTAKRAQDTWKLVAAELPTPPPVDHDERLYAAKPDAILRVLRGIEARTRSVLVVGHNPGLQELATRLIASGDLDHRERLREKFPTAGLVVIDFAVDSWSKLHPQSGRLERFVVPRTLAAATD